jgi:hypothetical protein
MKPLKTLFVEFIGLCQLVYVHLKDKPSKQLVAPLQFKGHFHALRSHRMVFGCPIQAENFVDGLFRPPECDTGITASNDVVGVMADPGVGIEDFFVFKRQRLEC